jgi:hypothetical protein
MRVTPARLTVVDRIDREPVVAFVTAATSLEPSTR